MYTSMKNHAVVRVSYDKHSSLLKGCGKSLMETQGRRGGSLRERVMKKTDKKHT